MLGPWRLNHFGHPHIYALGNPQWLLNNCFTLEAGSRTLLFTALSCTSAMMHAVFETWLLPSNFWWIEQWKHCFNHSINFPCLNALPFSSLPQLSLVSLNPHYSPWSWNAIHHIIDMPSLLLVFRSIILIGLPYAFVHTTTACFHPASTRTWSIENPQVYLPSPAVDLLLLSHCFLLRPLYPQGSLLHQHHLGPCHHFAQNLHDFCRWPSPKRAQTHRS